MIAVSSIKFSKAIYIDKIVQSKLTPQELQRLMYYCNSFLTEPKNSVCKPLYVKCKHAYLKLMPLSSLSVKLRSLVSEMNEERGQYVAREILIPLYFKVKNK